MMLMHNKLRIAASLPSLRLAHSRQDQASITHARAGPGGERAKGRARARGASQSDSPMFISGEVVQSKKVEE